MGFKGLLILCALELHTVALLSITCNWCSPNDDVTNYIMGYDVSVKLARKLLKRSKSPTPQFIKFDLLATPLRLYA